MLWSERWRPLRERLCLIENRIRILRIPVWRGGPYDRWDLAAKRGLLGAARALSAVEEHGGGKQLIRLRTWPVVSTFGWGIVFLNLGASVLAVWTHTRGLLPIVIIANVITLFRLLHESGRASAAIHESFLWHQTKDYEAALVAEKTCAFDSRTDTTHVSGADVPVSIRQAADSGRE